MYALVTPANSPYTLQFPVDSQSLNNEAFNINVSGAVTLILPPISSLPQTWNQKINITAIASNGDATLQPAPTDSIGNYGSGVAVQGPSGTGDNFRLQPSSASHWSAVETVTAP